MSIGVLHGQSGVAGLAVKVVGGTQRPSNGKQGIIWVNTDQKITSWTMQAEEPTEPAEGMVWVGILTSATLNALKKNGIWFAPTSAKQYSDGAWVKKTGEYFNNGQWVALFEATIHITYPSGSTCTVTDGTTTLNAPDTSGIWDCVVSEPGTYMVKLDSGFYESVEITQNEETHTVDKWYLYNEGNQYDDLTGGFVKKSSDGTGGSHSLGTTAITIKRNAGNGGAGGVYVIKAVNLIDLTNINALYAAGKVTTGSLGECVLKIYTESGSQLAYSGSLDKSAETTVSIDTTGISGKCIVAIAAEGSASTPAATYSISKIWAT